MRKILLKSIIGLSIILFSTSAMAAGQDFLSLMGLNNLTQPTSLATLQKTQVNCAQPPKAQAVNWADCVSGLQNMSISGLFGFDVNTLLNGIRTAACSYASQQAGAFITQATAPLTGAIGQVTGAAGGLGSVATPLGTIGTGVTTGLGQGAGGVTGSQGAIGSGGANGGFTLNPFGP